MSKAQKRLLELLVRRGPVTIHEAAVAIGTTVAGISNTRTVCRDMGWIENWKLWQGPIEITEAGRQAVAEAR